MYEGRLGIGLISFDRPHYFRRMLDSLERQNLRQADVHLFQDGSVNRFSGRVAGERKNIEECISLFRKTQYPVKVEHIRPRNIGNGINQFEAVEYLASHYSYFLIIEDDVVLGRDYLRLIRVMMDFLEREEVFSVSLNFKRLCGLKEINDNLDRAVFTEVERDIEDNVIVTKTHWWAECISSAKWRRARRFFMQYYSFISQLDYRFRPHGLIRKFFFTNGLKVPQTSQDAGKNFALMKCGFRRVTSVVNRGLYIGERGMHFRPELYKRYGFGEMLPYEFDSDCKLSKFILQS